MHGSDSKTLDECSVSEVKILTAILALALELPRDLVRYTRAFGEIRSQYFNRAGFTKPHTPNGMIDGHQPRVTQPWADLRLR